MVARVEKYSWKRDNTQRLLKVQFLFIQIYDQNFEELHT